MGTTTGEENLILVLAATIKMPISATPSTQLLDGLKITKAIRRQRNSRHHFHSSTSPTPAGQKLLANIGINKPTTDPGRYTWTTVRPGDLRVPRREHLLMAAIAQRTAWQAEYNRAKLAASLGPPDSPHTSATHQPAAA